jgi:hypothetical protein
MKCKGMQLRLRAAKSKSTTSLSLLPPALKFEHLAIKLNVFNADLDVQVHRMMSLVWRCCTTLADPFFRFLSEKFEVAYFNSPCLNERL